MRQIYGGFNKITVNDAKYRQWDQAYKYSIQEYLSFTNYTHQNDSKVYAEAFNKMQSHKIKVFFILLCQMHFADSVNIDGFEYDFHSFRLGK